MKLALTALAFALTSAVVAMPDHAAQAQQVTGAGATFPAPVYTKWAEQAKAATGIELNYQAIGSGGGQNQILQLGRGDRQHPRRADQPAQAVG